MTMEKVTPKNEAQKKPQGKKTTKKHCPHGHKRQYYCKQCKGAGICKHGRQRPKCKECGGSTICEHGRQRPQCKECRGSGICQHNRVRSQCKECGGSSICEHGRHRYMCKQCRGTSLCIHLLQKTRCKICKKAKQPTSKVEKTITPVDKSTVPPVNENEVDSFVATRASPCPHGYYRTSLCKDCGVSSPASRGTKRSAPTSSQIETSATIEPVTKRLASARSTLLSNGHHHHAVPSGAMSSYSLPPPMPTAASSPVAHGPQRVIVPPLHYYGNPSPQSPLGATTGFQPIQQASQPQYSQSAVRYPTYSTVSAPSTFSSTATSCAYTTAPGYPIHSPATVSSYSTPTMTAVSGGFSSSNCGSSAVHSGAALPPTPMYQASSASSNSVGLNLPSVPYSYQIPGPPAAMTYRIPPYHAAA